MENIRLNFLHICETVIVSRENNVSVINIFNEIQTPGFPAIHPRFSVISSISGPEGSYNQSVEVVAPTGEIISKVVGISEIKAGGSHNFIANFLTLAFPTEGKYFIRVKVDQDILSREESDFLLVKTV